MPKPPASKKSPRRTTSTARARTRASAGIVTAPAELERISLPPTPAGAEAELFEALKIDALATLAGGIAHDFNNILTGIVGYQELTLELLPPDEPAREYLAEARNAALRARTLVEQILTFGRRRTTEHQGSLDLAALITDTARALRPTLPASIALEIECAPGCGPLQGDAIQLQQLLRNLADNALDAMRAGGGTLRVALAPAEPGPSVPPGLEDLAVGSHLQLTVSDTGCGMDDAVRRRTFDPFFTTKPPGAGTGLGLAIVHAIVRAHHGAIAVETAPGRGAAFRVFLPIKPTPPGASASRAPSGGLICLVEDDDNVARCLRLVLERTGRGVVAFPSTDACLADLGADLRRVSAAVIDQSMPGAPGIELAVKLRRLRRDLPVVVMSAFFTKIAPDALGELGGFELLPKPFSTSELLRAIERAQRGTAAR